MVRAARVTTTSRTSPVSSPISAWARTASTTASADTVPVEPRSGERKIGTFDTMPAFSIKSPMRTMSLVTTVSALSLGCGGSSAATT